MIGRWRADVSACVRDRGGRRVSLFGSDVPLEIESELLQFIGETCLKYIATRGHYIIRVIGCKEKDKRIEEE